MPTSPPYQLLKSHRERCSFKTSQVFTLLLLLLLSFRSLAHENDPPFDEVAVLFTVPGVGNTEITAIIQNEEAWLPVKEVFDFLRIKNAPSGSLDSLSGFFINPQATYLIDKANNRITYRDKILDLAPAELIRTETGLYLSTAVFCQVFGLDCQFSFRSLTFTLKPNADLPALREMQQEQLRRNLSQLKGEKKADTTLTRSFKSFHLGMADWAVTAMQETARPSYLRANLSLGATLAGGEANLNLNYHNGQPFSPHQQFFRWRYVNNDLTVVKQVSLGRLNTQSISSIWAPVNGIQVTNTPTTLRKSFGTYRYTGTTEPEWTVELYVNNVLVNYAKADASGFFVFDIPIVYGNSSIRLKFYGPWGEEHTKEENISIPFNLLPERQFEYVVSAGIVDDESNSRFSRASFNYGLSQRITVGGGAEYLSSALSGRPMPYLNTSVRIGSGLIVNAEYTHGVRSKGTLNYRLPSNVQLDLSYSKYEPKQTAIRHNYLEERKASVSAPVRLRKFRAITRFTYNQFFLPKYKYGNAEFMLSTVVAGVSSNIRTYALFSGSARPYLFTDLSLSFRLPYGIRISPQVQYQYNQRSLSMLKADAEKMISRRSYLNLSYQSNPTLRSNSFTLGFRYDLSFARTFFSARTGNKTTSLTQLASGSLVYERKAGYARFDKQAAVGRGGFMVVPFLDINCNGRREASEPVAPGLKLRVSGGRVEPREDGALLITGLEAYASYLLELDKTSFDNIAWQIKNATIRATVEPNRLRTIEVPVSVVGEASGMVYLHKRGQQKGLSRILVNFYDSTYRLIAKTLTEGDGYFSYLGLVPGRYTAMVDTAQMRQLNLEATPASFSITIAGSAEGTIADGFEFVLRSLAEEEEDKTESHSSVPAKAPAGVPGINVMETKTPPAAPKKTAAVASMPPSLKETGSSTEDRKMGQRAGEPQPATGLSRASERMPDSLQKSAQPATTKPLAINQPRLQKQGKDSATHKPQPAAPLKALPVLKPQVSAASRQKPTTKSTRQTSKKPITRPAAPAGRSTAKPLVKTTAPRQSASAPAFGPVPPSTNLFDFRAQLQSSFRQLDQKHIRLTQKQQELIREQQLLLQRQRQLIGEIRELRRQLQQKQKQGGGKK